MLVRRGAVAPLWSSRPAPGVQWGRGSLQNLNVSVLARAMLKPQGT